MMAAARVGGCAAVGLAAPECPSVSAAFITGGSGFVGRRLIERLRAEGHSVRALARSERAAETVRSLGAEPVLGDLDDSDALRSGAEGCELAFHAAAALGDWGKREEFER